MGRDYQREKKTIRERLSEILNKMPKKIKLLFGILLAALVIALALLLRSCDPKVEGKTITVRINNEILQPSIAYTYEYGTYTIEVSANPSQECKKILYRDVMDGDVGPIHESEGSRLTLATKDDDVLSLTDQHTVARHTIQFDALYNDGKYVGDKKSPSFQNEYIIKIKPPVVENKQLVVTDQTSLREINPLTRTPIQQGSKIRFSASPSNAVEAIYYWYDETDAPCTAADYSFVIDTVNQKPGEIIRVFVNVLYYDGLFLDGNAEVSSGYLVYEFVIVE